MKKKKKKAVIPSYEKIIKGLTEEEKSLFIASFGVVALMFGFKLLRKVYEDK